MLVRASQLGFVLLALFDLVVCLAISSLTTVFRRMIRPACRTRRMLQASEANSRQSLREAHAREPLEACLESFLYSQCSKHVEGPIYEGLSLPMSELLFFMLHNI